MNYSTEEMVREMFNQSSLPGLFKIISLVGVVFAVVVCFFLILWVYKLKDKENKI